MPTVNIVVRLPPEVHDKLKAESAGKDQSLNYIITQTLAERYGITVDVVHRAPKKPRKKTADK